MMKGLCGPAEEYQGARPIELVGEGRRLEDMLIGFGSDSSSYAKLLSLLGCCCFIISLNAIIITIIKN
jgi:hypothetical protein